MFDFFRKRSVPYLVSLIWASNPRLVLLRFGIILLSAVLPLGFLYLIKLLADNILLAENLGEGIKSNYYLLGGILLFFLFSRAFDHLAWYITEIHKQKFSDYLYVRIQKQSMYLDYENFDSEDFSNIVFTIQRTGIHTTAQILDFVAAIIQNVFSLGFLFLFLLSYHWWMPLLLITPAVISLLINRSYVKRSMDWEHKNLSVNRKTNYVNYITVDKAYNPENKIYFIGKSFTELFEHLRGSIHQQKRSLMRYKLKINIPVTLIGVAFAGMFIYVLFSDALAGAISIGAIVMYIQAMQRSISTGEGLASALNGIQSNMLFIEQLTDYLLLKNKQKPGSSPVPSPLESISVKGLTFHYPGIEKAVLKNISVNFSKGTITGIVGENGSGKSTLIKLLTALYPSSEGSILINEHLNYAEIDKRSLWMELSIVYQDFMSYPHTTTLNVTGCLRSKEDGSRLRNALEIVGLEHLFEKRDEDELSRYFGDGTDLSMGQWQRLALARAIFRNASVLILDEPTSFIDGIHERKLLEYLETMKKDKIVIMISHKLSNIRVCDSVFLMKEGRIEADGTVTELMTSNEHFALLFKNQQE